MISIFVDDEADFPIRLVSDIIDEILASGSIEKVKIHISLDNKHVHIHIQA
jgi:hypothetical protein